MRGSRRPRSLFVFVLVGLIAPVLAPGTAVAVPGSQKAPTIDFTRDSAGAKPNGFTSVDNSFTHFSDSMGEDLQVADFSPQSIGLGLGVNGDDASALIIDFDVPVMKISLVFGNDDPGVALDGDVALLTVYRGGSPVGSESVVMNLNDEGDQVISVQGVIFRQAQLVFARGTAPINLIEVVDDIRISPKCTIRGTNGRDNLAGTVSANAICGFGAKDRIKANGGNDFAHGGDGKDRIRGGGGNDTVLGASGNDRLNVVDGVSGNDTVYGGDGNDTCRIDVGDATLFCEAIITVA